MKPERQVSCVRRCSRPRHDRRTGLIGRQNRFAQTAAWTRSEASACRWRSSSARPPSRVRLPSRQRLRRAIPVLPVSRQIPVARMPIGISAATGCCGSAIKIPRGKKQVRIARRRNLSNFARLANAGYFGSSHDGEAGEWKNGPRAFAKCTILNRINNVRVLISNQMGLDDAEVL
jgi:hypothetical protein